VLVKAEARHGAGAPGQLSAGAEIEVRGGGPPAIAASRAGSAQWITPSRNAIATAAARSDTSSLR
jgi:hypothetical protein